MVHPEQAKRIFQKGKSTLLCYGFLATGSLNTGGFSLGSIISSVGFLCSLINTKIAQNIISRISKVFLRFYSGVLILMFGIFVWLLFLFFN